MVMPAVAQEKNAEQLLQDISQSISIDIEKTGRLLAKFDDHNMPLSTAQREVYTLLKAAYLGFTSQNMKRVALVNKALTQISSANVEVKYLSQLSDSYVKLGDFEAALMSMNKGVRLLPKLTDVKAKVSVLQGAISLLVSLNAFEQAHGYANRLHTIGVEANNAHFICQGLTNKIEILFKEGNNTQARSDLPETLRICDVSDYKIMSHILLTLNAVDLVDSGQYRLGLDRAFITLSVLQKTNRKSDFIGRLQGTIAKAYLALQAPEKALSYANLAYKHAVKNDAKEMLKSVSSTLAQIKRAQGDFEAAFTFYDVYLREKESAEQVRLAKNIAYQRVKYDNLDKTNQLELLKFKHNSLSLRQKLQQRYNENLTLVVSLAAVLLVFLSILLVLSLRKKQSLLYVQAQAQKNNTSQGVDYHSSQVFNEARHKGCDFAVICFELEFLTGFDSSKTKNADLMLINQASAICQSQLRRTDQLSRINDERFIICVLDTTEHGAVLLAERCKEAILALLSKHQEQPKAVETTFSVAMIDDNLSDFNEVIAADKAMVQAKSSSNESTFVYYQRSS
jgi:diguanylate cyclase (GGDEF)-like protein